VSGNFFYFLASCLFSLNCLHSWICCVCSESVPFLFWLMPNYSVPISACWCIQTWCCFLPSQVRYNCTHRDTLILYSYWFDRFAFECCSTQEL
jgi:hypothetical protein